MIHLGRESVERARNDIITMQRWLAGNEPNSKDPMVKELRDNLFRTRCSLEKIMLERQ